MISLLIAAAVGLLVSIFGTPYAIRYFRRREIGQFIQEEIAGMHGHKQGTPTMGGVVFVSAAVIGYVVSHIRLFVSSGGIDFEFQPLRAGGLLAVFALIGMAVVGLL
ncbi:MAG TPA: phospho-N-acetylmuramoyl-pentapeptide-transferase, partial [Acidimicrobiia bacterium]|nr:phospho-N-acetylmuramoyl-pentapeptide-transferase [Acidimicrobiia bacterium]